MNPFLNLDPLLFDDDFHQHPAREYVKEIEIIICQGNRDNNLQEAYKSYIYILVCIVIHELKVESRHLLSLPIKKKYTPCNTWSGR